MNAILSEGLKSLGIKDDDDAFFAFLLSYIKEIKMFNAVFNLVKAESDEELVVSHILDSLAARKFFDEEIAKAAQICGQKVFIADAGSGAGFPGIPLAGSFLAARPEAEFFLIERMKKRCNFLTNVQAVLNLHNTRILETEAEKAPAEFFDIVTCRAFRPLDDHILKTLLRCAKPNGKLFLYKATLEKLETETSLIQKHGLNFRLEPLNCPFAKKERRLLIVEKNRKP